MNKLKWRIVFSCALGAFIGTVCALEFQQYSPQYPLGIIGLLLGGLVGYVACDYRQIPGRITEAWLWVQQEHETNFARIKSAVSILYPFFLAALVIFSWIIPVLCWQHVTGNLMPDSIKSVIAICCLLSLVFALVALVVPFGPDQSITFKAMLTLSLKHSPFGVMFYWLPKGIVVVWPLVPLLLWMSLNFMGKLCILLYSEYRILCLICSVLGACVGWKYGSPTLGMILGASIGLVAYELMDLAIKGKPKQSS